MPKISVAFAVCYPPPDDPTTLPPTTPHPLDWEPALIPGRVSSWQDATEQAAKGMRMILEDYEGDHGVAYQCFVNGFPDTVPAIIAEFLDTNLSPEDSLTLYFLDATGHFAPTLSVNGRPH